MGFRIRSFFVLVSFVLQSPFAQAVLEAGDPTAPGNANSNTNTNSGSSFMCKPSTQPKCKNQTDMITRVGLEGIVDQTHDIEARRSPDPKKGGWHIYEGGCDIYATSRKDKDGNSYNSICVSTESHGEVCDQQIKDKQGELCDPKGATDHHDLKLIYDQGTVVVMPIDANGNYDRSHPNLKVSGDSSGTDAPELHVDLIDVSKSKKVGSIVLVAHDTKTPPRKDDFDSEEVLCGRYCDAGGLDNGEVTVDPLLKPGIERKNLTTGKTNTWDGKGQKAVEATPES